MATVPPKRNDLGLAAPAAGPAAGVVPLPPGMAVGGFVVDALLHQGPQGFVYRASDRHGTSWALKEFFPHALALRMENGSMRARHAGDAILLSVAREAFHDEARALATLDQPGLVRVQDTLVAHHTQFRVMPLVPGERLDSVVAERASPPTVRELRALIAGLLAPLEALHVAGLLHGHVSPEQMLVAAPPVTPLVTLLGFGSVARELGELNDGPWAAPEVQGGMNLARVTSAADLYSVAACAWFAASGQPPPSAAERAHGLTWNIREGLEGLIDEAGDPPTLRAGLAQALEAALAMAPEARPQRVADMRRLLAGDPNVRLVSVQPPPLWVGEVPDRDEQRDAIEVIAPPVVAALTTRPADVQSWTEARVAAPRPDKAKARATTSEPSASAQRRWPVIVLLVLLGLGVAGLLVWRNSQRDTTPGPATPAAAAVADTSQATPSAAKVAATPATLPAPVAAVPAASEPVVAVDPPPARPAAESTIVSTVPLAPKAKPSAAVKSTALVAPRTACAGHTQFAQLYCMQEQCNRAALRAHPQCVELRRAGAIN